MTFPAPAPTVRLFAVALTALLLTACDEPLDYDLRGNIGAFSTAPAAQAASTAARPKPDARGVISYPSYQVAVSRRGDSVADVANRVGLPPDELARYNGMSPTDKLRPDEVLALPRRVAEPAGTVDIAAVAGSAIDAAPPTTPVATTPLAPAPKPAPQTGTEPVRHKVARGETAYTISRLYQVPVKSLAEWNGLGSDFAVREGQYLLIPVKNQPAPQATAAAVTAPGAGSPTPTPPSATGPLPDEKVAVEAPEKPRIEVEEPTRKSTAQMTMPVQGKIIRTYSKGKNDGIDIAGTAGAPIVAADAGTVAAITTDAEKVPIIILRHGGNLVSVYANVDKIEVNKGDTVKRGQTIARLRGGDKAYIHFEVRDGFDSLDPMPYLQ